MSCLDTSAAPVLHAAWRERWPPTPWTWYEPGWWTSGFCRAALCTKEHWTEWCRRGGTRASSPSTKGSGQTGCDWGPGTSSYPLTHSHSLHAGFRAGTQLFILGWYPKHSCISCNLILRGTFSINNVHWRWFFLPLTIWNGYFTGLKHYIKDPTVRLPFFNTNPVEKEVLLVFHPALLFIVSLFRKCVLKKRLL